MRVDAVVMEWGPADTSCTFERCYYFSTTGTDTNYAPFEGWVGQNWYWESVEVDSAAVATTALIPAVPEPSVTLLFAAGLVLIWFHRFGRAVQRPVWRTEQ